MGGIPTNYQGEVVTLNDGDPDHVIPGLMAIGEAACVSVHGANRLGSNSLLDLIVFGRAAALRAVELVKPGEAHGKLNAGAVESVLDRFDKLRHADGDIPVAELRIEMQKTMQSHAAVFRTGELIEQGLTRLRDLFSQMDSLKLSDRSMVWNTDLVEAIELTNLMPQAIVTAQSALNRTESRGAQARDDYPERDDENWMKHTLATIGENGDVQIDYRPVHMYTQTDQVEVIPPKARVY